MRSFMWTPLVAVALVAGAGCGEPPRCNDDHSCAAGSYCARSIGDCSGTGDCTERPQACDTLYDPVCGCDGKTYGNACAAAAEGVNVAARGACKVLCSVDSDCAAGSVCERSVGCLPPTVCVPGCHLDADCEKGRLCQRGECLGCPCPGSCVTPSTCRSGADCLPADYCAKEASTCGGEGTCATRPTACPENIDRVCGCDGLTYTNACEAAAAGVNVARHGACPVMCSIDGECPAGQVCELDVGCTRPMRCVEGCHSDADCGPNTECEARYCLTCPCPGACTALSTCTTNEQCPKADYCEKLVGSCQGVGACVARPEGCPKNLAPVCGCDGATYGNACAAAMAGVSVNYLGECNG